MSRRTASDDADDPDGRGSDGTGPGGDTEAEGTSARRGGESLRESVPERDELDGVDDAAERLGETAGDDLPDGPLAALRRLLTGR